MLVVGIETSCDETSVSVVKDGRTVLSNEVSSSMELHKRYRGIIPEIASRMQLETIAEVAEAAFKKAGINKAKVGLISVTEKPGLLGSLLVGINFARAMGLSLGVPVLGIDHLHGHIYANFLNERPIDLPFIALIVSGGHTSLFYVRAFDKISLIGSTQDDACGEAFDKVAKILGLGYPGGPYIEELARKGNAKKIKFRCSNTKNPLDFSFSGIKTAVLYYFQRHKACGLKLKADIAASFQESVIDSLIEKSFLACKLEKTRRIVVGGGVAANGRLRKKFLAGADENNLNVFFPPKNLCMDNAAMVAGLGYRLFKRGAKDA